MRACPRAISRAATCQRAPKGRSEGERAPDLCSSERATRTGGDVPVQIQHSSYRKAINMLANGSTWSAERIELLKQFFHAGLTCSQIANEIGVTRNAVIGKMSRLGLSRPRDVAGRHLEQRRAARLAR